MDWSKLYGKRFVKYGYTIHFHGEYNRFAVVSDLVDNMFIPSTMILADKLQANKFIHVYPNNPGVIKKALDKGYFLINVYRSTRKEEILFVAFGHPQEKAKKTCHKQVMRELGVICRALKSIHSDLYVKVKIPPTSYDKSIDVKLVAHLRNPHFREPYMDCPAVGIFPMGRRKQNSRRSLIVAPLKNRGMVKSLWTAGSLKGLADIRMQSPTMRSEIFEMKKANDGTEYAFFKNGRYVTSVYTEDLTRGQVDKLNKAFA